MLYRRFRWVALGALVRSLTRQTRERSVDAATDELARKLPQSVVRAAEVAPGDPLRFGGRAVATGRSMRQLGTATRRFGAASKRLTIAGRRLRYERVRSTLEAARRALSEETSSMERELWADYHRTMGDQAAADEALLDRRFPPTERGPLPEVPPPVDRGRHRHRSRPQAMVQRVQRTYRRAGKPWE